MSQQAGREMSFRDSISGRSATIIVGRGHHAGTFAVPKALLCNSSTYFEAALNGPFIEGQTQTITFDDEDSMVFQTYVAWLYQGQLNSQDIEGALDDPHSFGQHMAELIVFADKRGIDELKNDAISMLLHYLYETGLAPLEVINCIYEMPRSLGILGLRHILAAEEVYFRVRIKPGSIYDWHPEFMADIIEVLMKPVELQGFRILRKLVLPQVHGCKFVHKHTVKAEVCSSLAKNKYIPAPPLALGPPNKKRKIKPSTETVELLDDSE